MDSDLIVVWARVATSPELPWLGRELDIERIFRRQCGKCGDFFDGGTLKDGVGGQSWSVVGLVD